MGALKHPATLTVREYSIRPQRKLLRKSSRKLLVIPVHPPHLNKPIKKIGLWGLYGIYPALSIEKIGFVNSHITSQLLFSDFS